MPPPADDGQADCFDSANRPNPLFYYNSYSKTACVDECRVGYIVKKCGCRDFYQPRKYFSFRKSFLASNNLFVFSQLSRSYILYKGSQKLKGVVSAYLYCNLIMSYELFDSCSLK